MWRVSDQGRAFELSIVLPVHNEQPILEANVLALEGHLARVGTLDRFEILLVCNGCIDDSERISHRLAERLPGRVRALSLDTRGLGHAIRAGIAAASYDAVMFYAVDLPFGLAVVDDSIAAARANRNRIVLGSKGHPDSQVRRSLPRRMFSGVISRLNNVMFDLGVKDTMGSVLFPKAVFERYHPMMDSAGAFFQVQIVIYARQSGCEMLEIPVRLAPTAHHRATRFNPVPDAAQYIGEIFREKFKLITGTVPASESGS